MDENEVLGFDPTQLSVFNQEENAPKTNFNNNIYKTKPDDSKSEDHHYYATIKIIYNPFDLKHSILEQQSYGLQDADGWFTVVSSLTVNDTSCPIFKAWKKCHFSEKGSDLWKQAASIEDGGKALFDKRFARYVTIQVISDKNHPELEGKYMLWKLPKSIWELINTKMNPSKESGKVAIPVMDFLFGRSIDLEVIPGPGNPGDERYARDTKYIGELSEDVISCTNPDGSPLLNDREQAVLDTYVTSMKEVWKEKDPTERANKLAAINNDPNTTELRQIYARVLENIKKFCPNLMEELSYKEWSPEVKARVQKWIDIVLQGNSPKDGVAPTVVTEAPTPKVDESKPTAAAPEAKYEEDNSDLPF